MRKILHRCVVCRRYKGKPYKPPRLQWPVQRLFPLEVRSATEVDCTEVPPSAVEASCKELPEESSGAATSQEGTNSPDQAGRGDTRPRRIAARNAREILRVLTSEDKF